MSAARVEYLRDVLFPRAAAEGAFGPDAEYAGFRTDDSSTATDQFASDVVFGTVTLRTAGAVAENELPVVIKFKNADPVLSAKMNMNHKFRNECVFYARLLPELMRRAGGRSAVSPLFPRFVYSNATADDGYDAAAEQVIVVTNMNPSGYRMSDQRVFLDVDHVLLALRKLGEFHGLSYAAKAHADGADTFVRMTAALAETQWFDGHWYKSPRFLSGKSVVDFRFFSSSRFLLLLDNKQTAGRTPNIRFNLENYP